MFQDDPVVVSQIFEQHAGVLTATLSLGPDRHVDFFARCQWGDRLLNRMLNGPVHVLSSRQSWQDLLKERQAPVHISDDVFKRRFIHLAKSRTKCPAPRDGILSSSNREQLTCLGMF